MVFLLSLFVSCLSFAAEPLILPSDTNFYVPLTQHLEVYIDIVGQEDVADIVASPARFKPVKTKYPDFGLTEGTIWLRAQIINQTAGNRKWLIDINRQYYSEITIYKVGRDNTPQQLLRQTNDSRFVDRPIADRMLVTELALKAGESTDVYIGFRSDSTSYMPIGVGTTEGVASHRGAEHTLNWILNGALLAIIFFALMMTPVIGWRLSTSFALYMLSGFLFVFHADGYTFQYFWPQQPMRINDPLNLTFMTLMPVFGLVFSRILFNFKFHAPRFDKMLLAFIVFASVAACLSFPIYQIQTLKVIAYLLPPLGSLLQVCAGAIAIRRKFLGGVPYMIGAFIVMSSLAYAFIAHVVPGHFSLDATLDYGHVTLIAECFAFAAAIVIRLSGLRNERDSALRAELSATQDRLQLSAELQKSQVEYFKARKLSDSRKNQLSSVSHDLRQPLMSLRTALGNMNSPDEDAAQQMYAAFDYLETLAQDQLTGDKVSASAQKQLGELETFSVKTVLDNVYEMFKDEAEAKGLEFRYRPLDAAITSDPVKLMRIVNNLVSNAIKHTEHGSVLLAARRRGQRVRIEVWDTGAGMSEDEILRLSERGVRGETSDGSGLGIAIVKDISRDMGLDFKLRSRKGKGTLASLTLPGASD